mmetsp:Transcript_34582/g.68249  ORF Transcript_34582/g.68249 Transcript_34582/m.68249 type:complete len:328 (-) Transcript_34582:56-1039(-)
MSTSAQWIVTGGEDKGGIAVSLGKAAGSAQLPERLAPCSIIEQKDLVGTSLRYVLLAGTGPRRGWVNTQACTPLGTKLRLPRLAGARADDRQKHGRRSGVRYDERGEQEEKAKNEANEKEVREKEELAKQLQEQNVQVFDMCTGSNLDRDFVEIVTAKERAASEAEKQRLAVELEAMCWEDEESEQLRKVYRCQEEEAEAHARAANEQSEHLRQISDREEQERRSAVAAAAVEKLRRASGDTKVLVHVNHSLKIHVEFWISRGATSHDVKQALVAELTRKFKTARLDPETMVLRHCEDGTKLPHDGAAFVSLDVELEVSRDTDKDED